MPEKRIGKTLYRVSQLDMGDWLELEATLFGIVGQAGAELFIGIGEVDFSKGVGPLLAAKINAETIGRVFYALSQRADAATQAKIIKALSTATRTVDKKGDDHFLPKDHWQSNMSELAPWIAFALGVQFKDFFTGLKEMLKGPEGEESGSQSD